MISDKVIKTDAFMDMPATSKNLYFYLMIEADDDGFVSNPKTVMRMIGANHDDFKVLEAKRFIIPFESGVCVIKHWLIHNLIRADRKVETQWAKEKSQLNVDNDTKKYVMIQPDTPNDNQMTTKCQHRLGKVRLSQGNNPIVQERVRITAFDYFWELYPKKIGKKKCQDYFDKHRPDMEPIVEALEWQIESEQWNKKDGQFIPNPYTYLNQQRWLDEPIEERLPF